MTSSAPVGVALALAWTCSAGAQTPATVTTIVNPDWLQKPTADDMAKAWPALATQKGVARGRAVIACVVGAAGQLHDCAVASEDPANAGFGEAALNLSSSMLMRPKMVDGQPVDGAKVSIPVAFTGPAAQTVDVPPAWLRKPSIDQLMAAYPRDAQRKSLEGQGVIKCWVTVEGLLRSCVVLKETPEGAGFGAAALVLAPTLLMKPAIKDGHPVEAAVSIPIAFKLPPGGGGTAFGSTAVTVLGAAIWAQTPTIPEISAALDKKVGDRFADGKVAFQCKLDRKTAKLNSCVVINASPGMVQFQGVARSLIPKFQASPGFVAHFKEDLMVNLAFSFPDMSSPAWGTRYLTKPVWIQSLNAEASDNLFPQAAANAGLKTGTATVDCVVAANGGLGQCQVAAESTPGVGFGDMALKIAGTFAANPWTEDGLPAEGAHVRMPVRMNYTPKTGDAAPTPPTTLSASPGSPPPSR